MYYFYCIGASSNGGRASKMALLAIRKAVHRKNATEQVIGMDLIHREEFDSSLQIH